MIAASAAATPATPTAESASEAKVTISAALATKIQKLIPTERIPTAPMFKRGHDEVRGRVATLSQLTRHPGLAFFGVSQRIRAGNF
jgi:hypothetical protein